jgi:hypothetical protein
VDYDIISNLQDVLEHHTPIEHAKELHDSFLTSAMSSGRKLYGKLGFGVVTALNCNASPAEAMRTAILKFGAEFLDSYEVLVAVLVLERHQSHASCSH